MRRTYRRLTVKEVEEVAKSGKPGLYPDGDGLALQKTPVGVCSWIYRYQVGRSEHRMGLGALRHVGLKKAREFAADAQQMRRAGIDPLEDRRAKRLARATDVAKAVTFRQCAVAYVAAHRPGWRNVKHGEQWPASLERYVFGHFGDVPVQAVDVGLVMQALEPVWTKRPETATRVRQRIEAVLDWAAARGYRSGENPARWKGHLDKLLPKKSKVRQVEHHAALPYPEVADFLAGIRRLNSVSAKVLEFLILTATRSGEARAARWVEVDLAAKIWVVPPERMKAGREHRVPLSDSAISVLQSMAAIRQGEFIFPGLTGRAPLSSSALPQFLRSIGRTDITSHGFRSSFRDWAGEQTNFPREVCEAALAHSVGSATELAYSRGDMFRKRQQLMSAWAKFCAAAAGARTVVPIRKAAK